MYLAGLSHDLGKYFTQFQAKLADGIAQDCVRHEWLSYKVLDQLIKGQSWEKAWQALSSTRTLRDDKGILGRSLASPLDVVRYAVVTHHKLPAEASQGLRSISTDVFFRNTYQPGSALAPVVPIPESLERRLRSRLARVLKTDFPNETLYFKAQAIWVRAALILADHLVSAQNIAGTSSSKAAKAYANTVRGPDGTIQMNQPLDWHLETVAHTATKLMEELANLDLPALSPAARESLAQEAQGRFEWQNSAARALSTLAPLAADQAEEPVLVFSVADTGSGKTRMNARALEALAGPRPLRISAMFNLRTLTLQTADAYSAQLGLYKDELALVIGDRATRVLHEEGKARVQAQVDNRADDNPEELEIDVLSSAQTTADLPTWLEHFVQGKPKLQTILASPLLVSTADYLVKAGEPNRQGHHALGLVRLISSDLIIDEIDSYDPTSMVAILRLVQLSAFFGKNVIVSSATLSKPVARSVMRCFKSGVEMRSAQHQKAVRAHYAIIDNREAPVLAPLGNEEAFTAAYESFVLSKAQSDSSKVRVPELVPIDISRGIAGLHAAVADAARTMHERHCFTDPHTGKSLSVGVIRMANIRQAIPLARYLAEALPQARVACYHSQLMGIQRWHLEQRLDKLLTRKDADGSGPNKAILNDPEIRDVLAAHPYPDLPIIVVATPVEEVGRDHDFDWALIEPSSCSSIVQMAGRVQRHRLIQPSAPNIGILQHNCKAVQGKPRVFERPGLESAKVPYGSSDMAGLLDWSKLSCISAALRFATSDHRLSALDDESTEKQLADPVQRLVSTNPRSALWMSADTYDEYPLREKSTGLDLWMFDSTDQVFKREEFAVSARLGYRVRQFNELDALVARIPRHPRDIFVAPLSELIALARSLYLSDDQVLSVGIRGRAEAVGDLQWDASFGFCKP